MDIDLLGPLRVDTDGPALAPRDRVVLSALAVHPGNVLSAGQLADALWHDTPPESWAKVVQGCVVRIRKALGPEAVETTPHGYRLEPSGVRVDAREFERLVRLGHEHQARGLPERAVVSYERALELWRGEPFDELRDWDAGRVEAERLHELMQSCAEELLAARSAAGQSTEVTADAAALVSQEPWRERRWAVLALAQYRAGRQAAALASIRQAKAALGSQLGIDAGHELAALETAILNQDPNLLDGLEAAAETCPYKGLAFYDVNDRDAFFGRDRGDAGLSGPARPAPDAGPGGAIGVREIVAGPRRAGAETARPGP